MKRQHTHADWTLLPWEQFFDRADILLGADVELASSFIKFLHDAPALFLMLLAVLVLTFLVTIPNALAPGTLLDASLFLPHAEQNFAGASFLSAGSVSLSFLSADSPSDMELSFPAAVAVASSLDDDMVVSCSSISKPSTVVQQPQIR